MSMVCPQCNKLVAQALSCPTCKVRLLYHAQKLEPAARVEEEPQSQWQQTPWGRMLVGLILALGLSFGMQQLLTAWLLASGDESANQVWATVWGLVLLHSLQGLSLLIGGALTGAGQQRGVWYGAFVGLLNGVVFLLVERQSSAVLDGVAVYAQPLLHLIFGAAGGFLGQHIWKPVPRLQLDDKVSVTPTPAFRPGGATFLAGPVHLGRVLIGATVVVSGITFSNRILEFILNTGQGTLSLTSHLQAQLVAWEIAVLVIVIGAALAGATTFNGLKQGLLMGVAAGLVYVGLQLGNPQANLDNVLFMLLSMVGFGMVGGWFGSQLFPPVVRQIRRHRILTG